MKRNNLVKHIHVHCSSYTKSLYLKLKLMSLI